MAGPALVSGADPSPDRCRHGIHLSSRCGSCERSNTVADPRSAQAVRRGYDALIAAGHTPEAIRDAVLADDLDMAACDRCVIGHLYHISAVMGLDLGLQFGWALSGLGVDVAIHEDRYGFDIDDSFPDDEWDAYADLADEWRRLVAEMSAAS